MRAKKENKVYRIVTEEEKQRYLKEGFDIYDDDGELIEYSPLKKIGYGKYKELEKENERLREENGRLEKEIAELQKRPPGDADKKEGAKKGAGKAGG